MGKIIYFDGVCNLCNWSVRFVIKHDKKRIYSFASLQTNFAKNQSIHINGQDIKLDTIIYAEDDFKYEKSDAILKIMIGFGGLWRLIKIFRVIPKTWRDGLYDMIASNRYRWFGKKDQCMVPSNDIASRFIG